MQFTWSVVIPTYNAAKFLEETLRSVLACNYSEDSMEIWVVDNCSTDATKQIVERIGKGRIRWHQHERNIGMMPNFNACVSIASGRYVHVLNADDTVKPDFYQAFYSAFAAHKNIGLVCCNVELIDENSQTMGLVMPIKGLSIPTQAVDTMMYINPFRTPGVVVKKEAYARLGGFNEALVQTADWEMWVRVIYNAGGVCINKVLCCYREYTFNSTGDFVRSGKSLLEQELLYQKFEKAGYPIEPDIYISLLKKRARNEYIYFYLTDKAAFENVKPIHTRLHPTVKASKLNRILLYHWIKYQIKKVIKMLIRW